MKLRFIFGILLASVLSVCADDGFSRFRPEAVAGVWEVVSIESDRPRAADDPEEVPNYKYCFSRKGSAYPELEANRRSDSADGGGLYYLVH